MKYIFLDFDGVLNSDKYFSSVKYKTETEGIDDAKIMLINHWMHLDHDAIALMNQLVEQSGAQVIISSTWRLHYSIDELNKMLTDRGATFKAVDRTPRGETKKMSQRVLRENEIQEFLNSLSEPPESFVIIDDMLSMGHLNSNFIKTSFRNGFCKEHIISALRILNKEK